MTKAQKQKVKAGAFRFVTTIPLPLAGMIERWRADYRQVPQRVDRAGVG